jgi:ribosomal protein S18 acetylase RimI-like enzyme
MTGKTVNSIRPATNGELAPIEHIVHDAYVKYIERMRGQPGPMLDVYASRLSAGSVRVIEEGSTMVGVLVLPPKSEHLLLNNIDVASARQGRGFVRSLLKFTEAEAMRQGYHEIGLYTHETMRENQRLYAAIGCDESGRGIEAGYERAFMRKQLRCSR